MQKICPIKLSVAAIAEIRQTLTIKGIPEEYCLRIGTNGGGCSAISYIMGFDKKTTLDLQYEIEGIPVIIDKRHALFLWGVEIDFLESDQRGFIFNTNPQ